MSKRLLMEQARRNPILPAESLLAQSKTASYNEVVAVANNNGKTVRLVGFFIKVIDGNPIDEELAGRIAIKAKALNLPTVEIPEPNFYRENKIIQGQSELSVILNGKIYHITGDESLRFRSNSPNGYSLFTSPDEIEHVLKFLEKGGFDSSRIERIREDYLAFDNRRKRAKVAFDEQGNVLRIEKSDGYGETETKINISWMGASQNRIVDLAKAAYKKLYEGNQGNFQSVKLPETPLSLPEVKTIIQEAIQSASDEERQKIEAWWQIIKDKIQTITPSVRNSISEQRSPGDLHSIKGVLSPKVIQPTKPQNKIGKILIDPDALAKYISGRDAKKETQSEDQTNPKDKTEK